MVSWKSRKGQTSIEILIAMVILFLTTTAAYVLLATTLAENQISFIRERAYSLAQSGQEAIRQIAAKDFELLQEGTYGIVRSGDDWILSGTEDVTDGVYVRKTTIDVIDDNTRDITVEVTWNNGPGRSQTITLTTRRFTNWNSIETWGNWGTPLVVGSIDLGPEAQGESVSLRKPYVYLSATTSSGNKPTFYIGDVSNPTAPGIRGTISTGYNERDVLAVPDSNIVYITGLEPSGQLKVIDATDPDVPVILEKISLLSGGHSLFLDGNWLYVGAVNGLHIYDVTDPANPSPVTTLSIGTEVLDIVVENGIAYLSTPSDTQELFVVDVSTPETPSVITTRDVPGTKDAISLSLRTNRLYLGTLENSSTGPELRIYNVTTPTNPTLIHEFDTGGELNSMIAAGPYVFTATDISNSEFIIYRISDPLHPTVEAQLNMSQVATGLDFDDNTIYISLRSNDALQIIQASQSP